PKSAQRCCAREARDSFADGGFVNCQISPKVTRCQAGDVKMTTSPSGQAPPPGSEPLNGALNRGAGYPFPWTPWHDPCRALVKMASVVERFIASRRGTALVTAAALIAMLAMAVSAYSIVELSRFAQADVRRATIVYASGQALGSGLHVGLV